MKRTFIIALGVLSLYSCNYDPKADAEARFKQEQAEIMQNSMSHERYIDSLVNVAAGLEGVTLKANRQHALDILKSEYPELKDRWVDMQSAINNMEIYSESE